MELLPRLGLGPIHHPIQGVPVAPNSAVKWPGREADRSHPSSGEVQMLCFHCPEVFKLCSPLVTKRF
jgi:hypothetical protein